MKKNAVLMGSVIAAILTSASAFATSTQYTETTSGINFDVQGQTYKGTFTDAGLKSGGSTFNPSQSTITSAMIDLTIVNDAEGLPISLTVDGITMDLSPHTSPGTLQYTLNATQDSFLQSQLANPGSFNYFVTVDCTLTSAELIINTSSQPNTHVPDGASTAALFGGALTVLGWVKMKVGKRA
jgi:hypothetical protein